MLTGGAIKRYAQAVFALALSSNSFAAWQRDLDSMAELVNDESGRALFGSPKVDTSQKLRVAERYLQPRVSPLALNLTRLLIRRERFAQVDRLAMAFAELVREHQGVAVAEVTTAVPLDSETSAEVSQRLSQMVDRRVTIQSRVNPEIIGGIIARVGDYLIDGSVTGQLSRLRTRLIEGR